MGNLVFDGAIGLVPFFGDIADTIFKCNTRNAVLLEHMLTKRARKEAGPLNLPGNLAQDQRVDPSHPDIDARLHPSAEISKSSSPPQQADSALEADTAAITGTSSSRSAWMKHYITVTKKWLSGFRQRNRGEEDVEKAEGTLEHRPRA